MRHCHPIACLLLAAAMLLAGCDSDFHANQLVKPAPTPGGSLLGLAGAGARLVTVRSEHRYRKRIAIPGTDIELDTWIIQAEVADPADARGTVFMLHRYNNHKEPFLSVATRLADKGYYVVLADLRGHGQSSEAICTHGLKERYDMQSVLTALIRDKDIAGPYFVYGEGLGGVTAIMWAAIDDRIAGVISLDAYADFATQARWMIQSVPEEAKRQQILKRAAQIGGYRLEDASAVEAIKNVTCPVLIMHVRGNTRVPPANAKLLYEAASQPKELKWILVADVALNWEQWLADEIDRFLSAHNPKKPPVTHPTAKR